MEWWLPCLGTPSTRQCSVRPVNVCLFQHQSTRTCSGSRKGFCASLLPPSCGLTDNAGLMDCSITVWWQELEKEQKDGVIYVLNCSYSTRGFHHLSSLKPFILRAVVVWAPHSGPPETGKLMNDQIKPRSGFNVAARVDLYKGAAIYFCQLYCRTERIFVWIKSWHEK